MSFGSTIKSARKKLGKTLREVASDIRFDQSLLSKIERNQFEAPAKIIKPLALSLGLDFKSLQIEYWSERMYKLMKNVAYSEEALEATIQLLKSNTDHNLRKQSIIEKLCEYLSAAPVDQAWIFGSFSRNEENDDSDIDLLVKFSSESKLDLFDYIGIKQDLEDITGRAIDLVEEGQEFEAISNNIHSDKKLIYVRKEAV